MNADLIKKHFINPKNVGELSSPDAFGRVGSLTCGAVLRITLRVDSNQRITDSKFKAAGCSLLVASCSLLTEQVRGMATGDAAALAQSPQLAVPPPGREHCASLASEALLVAIRGYSDSVRAEWSGEKALICTCFGVSEQTIEREIKAGSLTTVAEVTEACNAGAGCRSCYSLIQEILDDYCAADGTL